MAARVGTGVSGSGTGVATVATSAKTTTTGNLNVVFVKWEGGGSSLTSVTDTAGNTYLQIGSTIQHTSLEPYGAMFYCANATGNASNVFTATFSGSTLVFIKIIAEEFSGIATSSVTDGAATTKNDTTSATYSSADITTTTSGLVFMGIAGYTTLSGHSGTAGNPDFTVGATNADTFIAYLISGSAQTVSPGASAAESDRWVVISQAFKDAGGGGGGISTAWLIA
jgi:hypothetical protein